MEKRLIMTVGLPRSGKSTWARQQGLPIVNADSLRLAIHGQVYCQEAERIIWTTAYYMVKALFLAGHDIVILDSCNHTQKRRDDWISKDWKRFYKVFDTSKNICIKRARESQTEYLIPVIKRMYKDFEPIQSTEDMI